MALPAQTFCLLASLVALGRAVQLHDPTLGRSLLSDPDDPAERLKEIMEVSAHVREACGELVSTDDFTSCAKVMPKESSGALLGIAGGQGLHAFSFGVGKRDKWSEIMSNRYGVSPRLYDCFLGVRQAKLGPMVENLTAGALGLHECQKEYEGICYGAKYEAAHECLGARNWIFKDKDGTEKPFVMLKGIFKKSGTKPFAGVLKLDVDGYEWDVLISLLGDHPMMKQVRTLDMVVTLGENTHMKGPKMRGPHNLLTASDQVKLLGVLAKQFAPLGWKRIDDTVSTAGGPNLGNDTVSTAGGPNLGKYALSFVNHNLVL